MVSIICCTIREQFMENVFQNYDRQTIEKKELIIILNDKEMDVDNWRARAAHYKGVSVYKLPDLTLGECLNYGIKKSRFNIIAKFDDDDYYTPSYLAQQVRALQYKKADLVCKRTVYMYFEENKTLAIHLAFKKVNSFIQKNSGVKGSTLVFRKKLWKNVKFHPINVGEDTMFLKKCLEEKFKIYATDHYNYVCVRRNEKYHTWQSNNKKLMSRSLILYVTDEYNQAVEKLPK